MPYNMHLLTLALIMGSPIWCAKIRSDADRDEIDYGIKVGLFRKVQDRTLGHVVVDRGNPRDDFGVELTPVGEELVMKLKKSLTDAGITNERGIMNLLAA